MEQNKVEVINVSWYLCLKSYKMQKILFWILLTANVAKLQMLENFTIFPISGKVISKKQSPLQTSVIPLQSSLCPPLEPNMDDLTQEHFIAKITDGCRYDKLSKPYTYQPLQVYMQIDLTHIETIEQLQFKAHMFVQYLYRDGRLSFENLSPQRGTILGEELLRSKIWVPHLMIGNEKDTSIMGIDGKDVFISISPKGDVVYSYRLTATFYCWMNLQKFPFDSQECNLKWNSWTYNSSNLLLFWNRDTPVKFGNNLHLTEFVLTDTWTEESQLPASFNKGAFVGNFSQLIFRFKLSREVGFYVMDYFLPSILLVVISWVTFWLQPDASPPRVALGTSTMLAFITLNGGLTKTLPKVSYIKASEIWFLACACFIFASMAEFAFVNVIWRRQKEVHLKKKSSKHILKGALTPNLARRELYKTKSLSSLNDDASSKNSEMTSKTQSSNSLTVPTIQKQQHQDDDNEDSVSVNVPQDGKNKQTWQTMTPHEVANWIDKKSRIVFPLSFLIFNILYWSFVYLI